MEQKQFKVGGAGAISALTVITLLFMINFADRSILTIGLQPIKTAFNLTDAQAGSLPGLFTLGIAILTIPVSILGDRWARRKVIGIMALIWSVFTFTTGIATQMWHLLVARFFVGSGEAGYAPVGLSWISLSFEKEVRSLIMGIFWVGGNVGGIIGLILGGWLITTTHDWRTPFYIFAIPGIILAIIAFFLPDYKTIKQAGEGLLSKRYLKSCVELFKIKAFWISIAGQALFYFTAFAFPAWMPTLLIRAFNMTTMTAGLTYGATALVVIIAGPLGGWLADKWQKHNKNGRPYFIALTLFVNLLTGFITLYLLDVSFISFIIGLVAMTITYGMILPASLAVLNDVTPINVRVTAIGMANFICSFTGATLGPILVGTISDSAGGGAHGIQTGLMYMLAISVLGVLAYLILPKFYFQESAGVDETLMAEK